MSEIFVDIPSNSVHTRYSKPDKHGDSVVDILQANGGEGYAIFKDCTLVYTTEEFDCLTEWIMKDLGLVD